MSRENGKDIIIQIFPETVAEYIDDCILPALADGTRTATEITEEILSQSKSRLDESKNNDWFYLDETYDLELIDSYCVIPQHKELINRYVKYVFDDWEGATK